MQPITIGGGSGNAALFDKSYRSLPDELSQERLKFLATVFARNCDKIFELQATLINLIQNSFWISRVDLLLRQKHNIPLDHLDASSFPDYEADAEAARIKMINERASPDYDWGRYWAEASGVIDKYIEGGIMQDAGSAALLSAMISQGWMCFESMASDLWKHMVNEFPDPLAKNILRSQISSDEPGSKGRALKVDVFDRYGFDLSHTMGELLLWQRRVFLDSVNGIEQAFRLALAGDWDADVLNLPMLKHHEALRNLYAHRGGRVDKTFIARMKDSMDTEVPLSEGQDFLVRGDEVRTYMNSMIESATNLLRFADGWLNGKHGGVGSQDSIPGLDP